MIVMTNSTPSLAWFGDPGARLLPHQERHCRVNLNSVDFAIR